VDIVGHSQGGMMPRWYLRFLGGRKKVDTLVGLAPSSHGTDLNGFTNIASQFGGPDSVAQYCPACVQQMAGSDFMNALNAGGDTERGVRYTVISTVHDEVVTPYQTQFLTGPNVTNITLQDVCVLDRVDHVGMIYDHVALRLVLNALDPLHPVPPVCTPVLPGVGG
jgi:triacylglycerol esterase/lipase EstA (alpha/beta hydrolase family)